MINSGSSNTIFIFDSNKMFSFMVVYNLCLDPNLTLCTYNSVDQYIENNSILPDIIVISNKLINQQALELLKLFKQKSPYISIIFISDPESSPSLNELPEFNFDFVIKEKESTKMVDKVIQKIFIAIKTSQRRKSAMSQLGNFF